MKNGNLKLVKSLDKILLKNGEEFIVDFIEESTFGSDDATYQLYLREDGRYSIWCIHYNEDGTPKFSHNDNTIVDVLRNGISIF